jgi:DNA-binding transcriptional regulator YiaG
MRAKRFRNAAVIKAYEEIGSPKQVAETFGITIARVNQILAEADTAEDPMDNMTGEDLRYIRDGILDMGTERFARLVGASSGSTIRGWETQDRLPRYVAIIAFLIENSLEARRLLIKKRLGV